MSVNISTSLLLSKSSLSSSSSLPPSFEPKTTLAHGLDITPQVFLPAINGVDDHDAYGDHSNDDVDHFLMVSMMMMVMEYLLKCSLLKSTMLIITIDIFLFPER